MKLILHALLVILLLSSCDKKPAVTVSKNVLDKAHIRSSTNGSNDAVSVIVNEQDDTSATPDAHSLSAEITKSTKQFDNLLTVTSREPSEDLGLADLTDEKIQQFLDMFPNPWEAERILWDRYIVSNDADKLLVAKAIFTYIIEKYDDEHSQAYARDHLGQVLERIAQSSTTLTDDKKIALYSDALAMFDSVQLQSDGKDVWYSDAKNEAGDLLRNLPGTGLYPRDEIIPTLKKSVAYYDVVLQTSPLVGVKAAAHHKKGLCKMNYDPWEAVKDFELAKEIYLKANDKNQADQAQSQIDFIKKAFPKNFKIDHL